LTSRRADATATAIALVGAVAGVDLLWSVFEGSTGKLAYGLFDEPAHLATCALALLAAVAVAGARPPLRFAGAALIASVAIDVDHLPGYLGSHMLTGHLPRPYTHSFVLVGALAALGLALKRREQRQVALGVAFGVSAHLVRDLATGPGVPALWPLDASAVTLPYAAYIAALVGMAAAVAVSARRGRAWRRAPRRLAARPLPSGGPRAGS
jgi:inner membrane protein